MQTEQPIIPLVTENLKYSAYYWNFNHQVDSLEFYLVHYIAIDNNGRFFLMRHDNLNDKPRYFTGFINDTIRQFIGTTFYNDNFKADYSWKADDRFVYDGFTYCFDYQKENNGRKKIQFIRRDSLNQFKIVSSVLTIK